MEDLYYLLRGNGLDEAKVMGAINRAKRRFYLRPAYLARHAGDLTRLVASKWGLAWHVAARVLFGTKVSEGHGRATGPDAPVAPDVPAGRPARQVR